MEEHTVYKFNEILPIFNLIVFPPKRTYLYIVKESHDTEMNSRIDNYKLITKNRIPFENNFIGNGKNSNDTKKS